MAVVPLRSAILTSVSRAVVSEFRRHLEDEGSGEEAACSSRERRRGEVEGEEGGVQQDDGPHQGSQRVPGTELLGA